VEYAIVLLLLFTMLFGICCFGHALYAYHFVSHAAKSAARWAAVNGSTCASDGSCTFTNGAQQPDVRCYVKGGTGCPTAGIVPPGIDPGKLTVNASWCTATGCPGSVTPSSVCTTTNNSPGCPVEVTVSYQFSFIFPLVSSAPLTLSSSSEMVIAH
jgi:Flp pilus assembly protein TadG